MGSLETRLGRLESLCETASRWKGTTKSSREELSEDVPRLLADPEVAAYLTAICDHAGTAHRGVPLAPGGPGQAEGEPHYCWRSVFAALRLGAEHETAHNAETAARKPSHIFQYALQELRAKAFQMANAAAEGGVPLSDALEAVEAAVAVERANPVRRDLLAHAAQLLSKAPQRVLEEASPQHRLALFAWLQLSVKEDLNDTDSLGLFRGLLVAAPDAKEGMELLRKLPPLLALMEARPAWKRSHGCRQQLLIALHKAAEKLGLDFRPELLHLVDLVRLSREERGCVKALDELTRACLVLRHPRSAVSEVDGALSDPAWLDFLMEKEQSLFRHFQTEPDNVTLASREIFVRIFAVLSQTDKEVQVKIFSRSQAGGGRSLNSSSMMSTSMPLRALTASTSTQFQSSARLTQAQGTQRPGAGQEALLSWELLVELAGRETREGDSTVWMDVLKTGLRLPSLPMAERELLFSALAKALPGLSEGVERCLASLEGALPRLVGAEGSVALWEAVAGSLQRCVWRSPQAWEAAAKLLTALLIGVPKPSPAVLAHSRAFLRRAALQQAPLCPALLHCLAAWLSLDDFPEEESWELPGTEEAASTPRRLRTEILVWILRARDLPGSETPSAAGLVLPLHLLTLQRPREGVCVVRKPKGHKKKNDGARELEESLCQLLGLALDQDLQGSARLELMDAMDDQLDPQSVQAVVRLLMEKCKDLVKDQNASKADQLNVWFLVWLCCHGSLRGDAQLGRGLARLQEKATRALSDAALALAWLEDLSQALAFLPLDSRPTLPPALVGALAQHLLPDSENEAMYKAAAKVLRELGPAQMDLQELIRPLLLVGWDLWGPTGRLASFPALKPTAESLLQAALEKNKPKKHVEELLELIPHLDSVSDKLWTAMETIEEHSVDALSCLGALLENHPAHRSGPVAKRFLRRLFKVSTFAGLKFVHAPLRLGMEVLALEALKAQGAQDESGLLSLHLAASLACSKDPAIGQEALGWLGRAAQDPDSEARRVLSRLESLREPLRRQVFQLAVGSLEAGPWEALVGLVGEAELAAQARLYREGRRRVSSVGVAEVPDKDSHALPVYVAFSALRLRNSLHLQQSRLDYGPLLGRVLVHPLHLAQGKELAGALGTLVKMAGAQSLPALQQLLRRQSLVEWLGLVEAAVQQGSFAGPQASERLLRFVRVVFAPTAGDWSFKNSTGDPALPFLFHSLGRLLKSLLGAEKIDSAALTKEVKLLLALAPKLVKDSTPALWSGRLGLLKLSDQLGLKESEVSRVGGSVCEREMLKSGGWSVGVWESLGWLQDSWLAQEAPEPWLLHLRDELARCGPSQVPKELKVGRLVQHLATRGGSAASDIAALLVCRLPGDVDVFQGQWDQGDGALPLRLLRLLHEELAASEKLARAAVIASISQLLSSLAQWTPPPEQRGSRASAAKSRRKTDTTPPALLAEELSDWRACLDSVDDSLPLLGAFFGSVVSQGEPSPPTSLIGRACGALGAVLLAFDSPSAFLFRPLLQRLGGFSDGLCGSLLSLLLAETVSTLATAPVAASSPEAESAKACLVSSLAGCSQSFSAKGREFLRALLIGIWRVEALSGASKPRKEGYGLAQTLERLGVRREELLSACGRQGLDAEALLWADLRFDELRSAALAAEPKRELHRARASVGFGVSLALLKPEDQTELRGQLETTLLSMRDADGLWGLGEASLVQDQVQTFLLRPLHRFCTAGHCERNCAKVVSTRSDGSKDWAALTRLGRWDDAFPPKQPSDDWEANLFAVLHSQAHGRPQRAQLGWEAFREGLQLRPQLLLDSQTTVRQRLGDIHRSVLLRDLLTSRPGLARRPTEPDVESLTQGLCSEEEYRAAPAIEELSDCGGPLELSFHLAELRRASQPLVVLERLSRLFPQEARRLRRSGRAAAGVALLEGWEALAEERKAALPPASLVPLRHLLEKARCRWSTDNQILAHHDLFRSIGQMERVKKSRDPFGPSSATQSFGGSAGEADAEGVELSSLLASSLLKLASIRQQMPPGTSAEPETPQQLIEKALGHLGEAGKPSTRGKAHLSLARLAEAEMSRLEAWEAGPEAEDRKQRLQSARRYGDALRNVPNAKTHLRVLEKQKAGEEAEIQQISSRLASQRRLALEQYAEVLHCSSSQDWVLFRLLQIWMDRKDDEAINHLIHALLGRIPEHKWIGAWNQLVGELNSPEAPATFAKVLRDLMEGVMQKHPYQTFYAVFAASQREKDGPGGAKEPSPKKARRSSSSVALAPGTSSASELLQRLETSNAASVMRDLKTVGQAYKELVLLSGQTRLTRETFDEKGASAVVKAAGLPGIASSVPVAPDGDYKSAPPLSVTRLSFVAVMASKTKPVQLKATLADGSVAMQLVKGKDDDLRQDALIAQVFRSANEAMDRGEAKGLRLHSRIRTYNAVPLGQLGGVIEMMDGVMPLGSWLVGDRASGGAHQRYRPQDRTQKDIRQDIAAHKPETRIQPGPEHMERYFEWMHPVLGLWWVEKWGWDAGAWLAARRRYADSLALSSMVGDVVGLGDRHTTNVMLDTATGELVHIDFGVCFESGRLLQLPELVPFRLTRDLVHPLGVSGVEGRLRRSCEAVLGQLGRERDAVLPMLAALTRDPLSTWSTTALRKDRKNLEGLSRAELAALEREAAALEAEGAAFVAAKAFRNAKAKLEGRRGTELLSVPQHVDHLLREATDIAHLSSIYFGWAPWL